MRKKGKKERERGVVNKKYMIKRDRLINRETKGEKERENERVFTSCIY